MGRPCSNRPPILQSTKATALRLSGGQAEPKPSNWSSLDPLRAEFRRGSQDAEHRPHSSPLRIQRNRSWPWENEALRARGVRLRSRRRDGEDRPSRHGIACQTPRDHADAPSQILSSRGKRQMHAAHVDEFAPGLARRASVKDAELDRVAYSLGFHRRCPDKIELLRARTRARLSSRERAAPAPSRAAKRAVEGWDAR